MPLNLPRGGDTERRAPQRANRLRRRLLHVVAVLHRWAESGRARTAVVTWAVLQGSVVLGPADALLVPLGLADPRKVWSLAACAAAGSTVGGMIAYWIGALAFDEIGAPLLHLFGVGQQQLASSRTLFQERGWMVVLLSPVSPIPVKVVSMAAGAFGMPFTQFLLTHLGVRTARCLAVATLLRLAGGRIVGWIERRLGRPISTLR